MTKRIGLIAHDAKKPEIADWAQRHRTILARHALVATGSTGGVIMQSCPELKPRLLKSGPRGGDQQMGALIAEGALDCLVFFTDPMSALPHDVDVKALLRLTVLCNVAIACNAATADLLIEHPAFAA